MLFYVPGSLSNDDGDGKTRTVKSNRFGLAKRKTLHVHHSFLHSSYLSLLDFCVKVPNFTFCLGRSLSIRPS